MDNKGLTNTPSNTRTKRRGRGRLALLVVAGLLTVALAASVLYGKAIAGFLLAARLSAALETPVRLEVVEIDMRHVAVRDLRTADGGLAVAAATLRYDLWPPLDVRLRAIEASGLRLRGRLDPAPSFGPLDRILHGDGGRASAAASLPPVALRDVTLALDTDGGTATAVLDASARPVGEGAAFSLAGSVTGARSLLAGTLGDSFRFDIAGRVGATNLAAEIGIEGPSVRLTGTVETRDDGGLRFTARESVRLTFAEAPAWWPAGLPLAAPDLLVVSGGDGEPWVVEMTRGDGRWTVSTAGRGEARLPHGQALALEVRGSVRLPDREGGARFDLDRVDIAGRNMLLASGRADITARLREVALAPPLGKGTMTLDFVLKEPALGSVAMREAAFSGSGRVVADAARIAWMPEEPGRLWVDGLTAPGVLAADGLLAAPVRAPQGQPLVELSLRDDPARLLPHLRLGPFDARFALGRSGASTLETRGTTLALDGPVAIGTWAYLPQIVLRARQMDFPGQGIEGEGVTMRSRGWRHGLPVVDIEAEKVRPRTQKRVLALSLSGRVTPEPARLDFAGDLRGGAGRVGATLDGAQSFAGPGFTRFVVEPMRFRPGDLQPHHLLPGLSGWFSNVSGGLRAEGRLRWGNGAFSPMVEVALEDIAAETRLGEVAGVEGTFVVDGFAPVTTPPSQRLFVSLIKPVVPMRDGTVAFQFQPGWTTRIESAVFALAGGTVRLDDTVVDLAAAQNRLPLAVEAVDLERLVNLLDVEGLTVTGAVSGVVPITLGTETALVDGARLTAQSRGVIRYRPERPPAALAAGGQPVGLLLQALNDFRYHSLEMRLRGRLGGELTALVHIEGSNPNLYEGYPLEFNLNISGHLDRILDGTLSGYQIPDRVRGRMSHEGAR